MLQMLIELKSAKYVLEVRTLDDYSTIFFGCALLTTASNDLSASKLINLERSLKYAALYGLSELIPNSEPAFDVIFIDADKLNSTEYYKKAIQLSKSGAIIVADNVIRGDTVLNSPSDDLSMIGIHAFNDHVSQDSRVGCKSYDGFAIIQVKK